VDTKLDGSAQQREAIAEVNILAHSRRPRTRATSATEGVTAHVPYLGAKLAKLASLCP
jgi:hypothetical protein